MTQKRTFPSSPNDRTTYWVERYNNEGRMLKGFSHNALRSFCARHGFDFPESIGMEAHNEKTGENLVRVEAPSRELFVERTKRRDYQQTRKPKLKAETEAVLTL